MPLSSRSMLYVVAIIAPLLDTIPITSTMPLSSSPSWRKKKPDFNTLTWLFGQLSPLLQEKTDLANGEVVALPFSLMQIIKTVY